MHSDTDKTIWLSRPAPTGQEKGREYDGKGWNEALPIGNGSLGAMIYGDPVSDIIQLNEETVWSRRGIIDRVNPKSKNAYKRVRELLEAGKIDEAIRLETTDMYPEPQDESHYSTVGFLRLGFFHKEYSDYKRVLDLKTAVCSVGFSSGRASYLREYFASCPDSVIALHESSPDGGKISLGVDFAPFGGESVLDENGVYIRLQADDGGCDYVLALSCETVGGMSCLKDDRLDVYEADEVTIYITIRTDYHSGDYLAWCSEALENAANLGYDAIKARHIADYKSYFERVKLDLETDTDYSSVPTDERLKSASDRDDPKLCELYFDFGRYLLISCSRPNTLPANLQGIWNKDIYPAWGGRYTININTEMNYWGAESLNLSDCHMPLLEHLKRMLPNGEKVAVEMYGIEGFCAHHNTDIFGDCAPQAHWISATIWCMGAAWLCTHIWTHYEYTLDEGFLKEYLPIMKRACLFLKNYMFIRDGKLMTGPSVSPENVYIHPSGEQGSICLSPTMDIMITRDLFEECIKASKILGCEDELTEGLHEMLPLLPEIKTGKNGGIMEWREDYDEVEKGHRHISQLYGLYPSDQINLRETSELFEAARNTLERRLRFGGGHTGWSRAWIINMWARLFDGEEAGKNLRLLLSGSTYPNMFDKHPPFQIDGNFGGAAGIKEMLLQDCGGVIRLLPALPKYMKSGSVKGLKARGDVTVNISWRDGKVEKAVLRANKGGKIALSVPDGCQTENGDVYKSEIGEPYTVFIENGKIEILK